MYINALYVTVRQCQIFLLSKATIVKNNPCIELKHKTASQNCYVTISDK